MLITMGLHIFFYALFIFKDRFLILLNFLNSVAVCFFIFLVIFSFISQKINSKDYLLLEKIKHPFTFLLYTEDI